MLISLYAVLLAMHLFLNKANIWMLAELWSAALNKLQLWTCSFKLPCTNHSLIKRKKKVLALRNTLSLRHPVSCCSVYRVRPAQRHHDQKWYSVWVWLVKRKLPESRHGFFFSSSVYLYSSSILVTEPLPNANSVTDIWMPFKRVILQMPIY